MISSEPAAQDPGRCPLCGGKNHCPMALHPPDRRACWCHDVLVPQELLARLPEHLLHRACICEDCIRNLRDAPTG